MACLFAQISQQRFENPDEPEEPIQLIRQDNLRAWLYQGNLLVAARWHNGSNKKDPHFIKIYIADPKELNGFLNQPLDTALLSIVFTLEHSRFVQPDDCSFTCIEAADAFIQGLMDMAEV